MPMDYPPSDEVCYPDDNTLVAERTLWTESFLRIMIPSLRINSFPELHSKSLRIKSITISIFEPHSKCVDGILVGGKVAQNGRELMYEELLRDAVIYLISSSLIALSSLNYAYLHDSCRKLTVRSITVIPDVNFEEPQSPDDLVTLPQAFDFINGYLWQLFYRPSAIRDSEIQRKHRQDAAVSWLWESVKEIWTTHCNNSPGPEVEDALYDWARSVSHFFERVGSSPYLKDIFDNELVVGNVEKIMREAFETSPVLYNTSVQSSSTRGLFGLSLDFVSKVFGNA